MACAVPDNLATPTMETIPYELLLHIFTLLDAPRASTSHLLDEPTFTLTHSAVSDLKSVSLVSRRWRKGILPKLFKHARVIVPKSNIPTADLQQMIRPFLDFVAGHSLTKAVSSFTLLLEHKNIPYKLNDVTQSKAIEEFWNTLFAAIDLTDLLIVAPVEVLAILTSCHITILDSWVLDCPCHYIRLQRPSLNGRAAADDSKLPEQNDDEDSRNGQDVLATGTSDDVKTPSPSSLFAVRPWTSLLLNEGSFIKAYTTYEFYLRALPSVSNMCLCDSER